MKKQKKEKEISEIVDEMYMESIKEYFRPITYWFVNKLTIDGVGLFFKRYIFFVAWATIILSVGKALGLFWFNWEFVLFPITLYVFSIGFILFLMVAVYGLIQFYCFLKDILTWK